MNHVVFVEGFGPGSVVVDGPEGHHAADVRRLRVGESATLVDGLGHHGTGAVTAVTRGSVTVEVGEVGYDEPAAVRVIVVQALPKGERAELAVELCSEVGVDEVVPWSAARCITRWSGERGDKGLARWRSVAREAGKQARRPRFLEVSDPLGTPALLDRASSSALTLVLDAEAPAGIADVALPATGDVLLVVGPEGGLEDAEVQALVAAGAVPLRLGPSVLRTSSAGAAAAAVLLSRLGRWG